MQNNSRLGCLTGTGIFATLVALFALVGVALASGAQMFSAGALNAQPGDSIGGVSAHAQITECSACHVAPWDSDTMAQRCVVCHQDIVMQTLDAASLHGVIMADNPASTCRDCHSEHNGVAGALTQFNAQNFPHDKLGYSLQGHKMTQQNQDFQCADCHHSGYDFSQSTCEECHRQIDDAFVSVHIMQFGADCLACHDGVDKFGKSFNHQMVFALEGKHAEAGCGDCHANARSAVDLHSAPTDCYGCHQHDDKHAGAYGINCAVCHNPTGWLPAKFDHNLSDFKLIGEHNEASCEQCHINNVFKGTPQDCYSCHKRDDEHNGRFGTSCEFCHTPNDWDDANFNHDLSAFPLTGEHREADCEDCHVNNVFKGTPQDCYSCHKQDDEHNGQFGTDCSACHDPSDWDNATFDHNRTNFPLSGGHSGVSCESCHKGGSFKGLSTDCVSCHADPGFHAGAFGTDCASCHSVSAWAPAGFNFSHPEPRTDEGGSGIHHGGASCRTCHPSSVFAATCDACHKNGFEDGEDGDDD